MTTVYVSQSADNGYRLGVNSGSGDTKATAWLTVEYALANVSSGDTIIINDGTYIHSAAGLKTHDVGVANLTIHPENINMVTLKGEATSTFGALRVDDGSSGFAMRDIILDGDDTISYCMAYGGTGVNGCTLTRVTFKDATAAWVNITASLATSFIDCIFTSSALTIGGIFATGGVVGVTVSGGTMSANLTNGGDALIAMNISTAGAVLNVSDVTMTTNPQAGNGYGILVEGMASVTIANNTINMSGINATYGIAIENDAVDDVDVCEIYGNTITSSAVTGIGIQVGDDLTPGVLNTINDAMVYNNTVNGFAHGILLGHITSGKAFGNTVTGLGTGSTIGIICKVTITCTVNGNVVSGHTTSLYNAKYDTDSTFANNLGYLDAGGTFIFTSDTGGVGTGTVFKNNICYATASFTRYVDVSTAASTAIFDNNDYYSTVSEPTTPWEYQASTYTLLGLWNLAAIVGTDLDTDPELDDSHIAQGLIGQGIRWWTGANPVGLDGEPFSDFDIDMGAVQSTLSPFHPVNL